MDTIGLLKSIGGLGGLSLVFGVILALAFKKLAVKMSEEEKKIRELLPGANCGACGYPGCDAYAAALVAEKGEVPANLCTAGGSETAHEIAEILGMEVEETEPLVCALRCRGGCEEAVEKFRQSGEYGG